ncbi:uncharacterized protein [Porites lutea]|uniref:uncharacterized protein n=1 Tax=Porites lutea TaxID=51062 RepID=UPI003CC6814F
MGKTVIILVSVACVLFSGYPSLTDANRDVVIDNKCTEDESRKKDMMCARKFLEKMKQPSASCSHEVMKYRECFKNFTLNQCFGDYIRSNPQMRHPLMRMADIKSRLHNFAQMMCGIMNDSHPINTTGLPDKIKHMLKCKPEYFDKAKDCAKPFHDMFKKPNRDSRELCKGYLMAKVCNGRLMKENCEFERPPPRDHFNPFCKDMKDPPYPQGGADNARTSMVFLFLCLVFVLFFP